MPAEQMITHDFDRLLAQWPGFFEQLVLYVDDIRKYGTLKQAIADTENKLKAAKEKLDAFEADLGTKQQALLDAHAAKQQELETIQAARKTDIDNMMLAAKLDADNIKNAGNRAREQIIAEAQAVAATAEKRRDKATREAEAQELLIGTKESEIATLDTTIQAKQAELSRVDKAISDLRAKIA